MAAGRFRPARLAGADPDRPSRRAPASRGPRSRVERRRAGWSARRRAPARASTGWWVPRRGPDRHRPAPARSVQWVRHRGPGRGVRRARSVAGPSRRVRARFGSPERAGRRRTGHGPTDRVRRPDPARAARWVGPGDPSHGPRRRRRGRGGTSRTRGKRYEIHHLTHSHYHPLPARGAPSMCRPVGWPIPTVHRRVTGNRAEPTAPARPAGRTGARSRSLDHEVVTTPRRWQGRQLHDQAGGDLGVRLPGARTPCA